MRALTFGLLAAGLLGSPAVCQPLSPAAERAIDAAMGQALAAGVAPGGAVAVMRQGKVVFARGYGLANLETRTPATPDTVFHVGSVTKQFTAAAILLLAEDGKLSLDDKLSRYVPEVPRGGEVTLAQLLNHTSGIAAYTARDGFDRETMLPHTPRQLLDYILDKTPLYDFEPGTRWAYSNSNYSIAGLVVERVSGQPLKTFVQTRLLDPLGLTETAIDSEADIAPGRASGYDPVEGKPGAFANTQVISMTVPYGAGALRSSALDLVRWEDALLHGRVLRAASLARMTTPGRLNDGALPTDIGEDGKPQTVQYGFGLSLHGPPGHPDRISHNGGINGFASDLVDYPASDTVLAVIVNGAPHRGLPFADVEAAVKADTEAAR